MSAALKISTFGGLSIMHNSEPVGGLASHKVEALLVYLACNPRVHSREALAEMFWEGRTQKQAMNNLRVALSSLRKHLGEFVLITRETVAVNTQSALSLDAVELERGLRVVQDQGSIDSEELAAQVEQCTMEIYRGEFLEGFYIANCRRFEEWTLVERERLRRLVVDGLYKLVNYDVQRGASQAGLRHARRLLELDPLMEPAQRAMMRLLAYSGQRTAALEQFAASRRLLHEQLGVEPSQASLQLYQQIQAGELEPLTDAPVGPVEAISPAAAEPAPKPPPFLTAAPAEEPERPLFVSRQRELKRLDTLFERALNGEGSVVFVTGGPGRGKTALLEAFAQQAMAAQPDLLVAAGSCNAYSGISDAYLPFREILTMLSGDVEARWAAGALSTEHARRLWSAVPLVAEALLARGPHLFETFLPAGPLLARTTAAAPDNQHLLQALGAQISSLDSERRGLEQSYIFEQYTNVLHVVAAERPLLLILDDLQWADETSIGLLFYLGRRLRGVRLLIAGTCRHEEIAIGREGRRHPLEKALAELKLQYGDIEIDLAGATEHEGRGFVDALLDSEPNRLDGAFREALYRRTDGQPLFTIELLRAMKARGDLQTDETGQWIVGASIDWGALPARVEAVIGERMARLEAEQREMLTIASVEGEDFTAQVAAQVQQLPERQVLRVLSSDLEKRHHLVHELGSASLDGRILSRYRFAHALFQNYLYNELSEGERSWLHRAVGGALEVFYAGRIEEIAAQLARHFAGDDERELCYTRLAGEQAAARYANVEARRHFDRALALAPEDDLEERFELLLARESILDRQLERQMQKRDLQMLAQLAEVMGDGRKQAQVALLWARYSEKKSDYPAMIDYARQAIRLGEATQDVGAEAEGYLAWGQAIFSQGDKYSAQEKLERALELARSADLKGIQAAAYTYLSEGDPEDRYHAEQALHLYRQIGDLLGEAITLRGLAVDLLSEGDFAGARTCCEEALVIIRKIGDRYNESMPFSPLSYIATITGDFSRAREMLEEGLQINRENERVWPLHQILYGYFFDLQGEFPRAMEYYEQGLRLSIESRMIQYESWSLMDMGHLSWQMGEYQTAMAHSQKALRLAQDYGHRFLDSMWHVAGLIHESLGDLDEAENAYRQALDIRERLRRPHTAVESQAGLARLYLARGEITQAQAYVKQILQFYDCKLSASDAQPTEDQDKYHPFDGPEDPVRIYLTCYRVLEAVGDRRAREMLEGGYKLLRRRAATIDDDKLRSSYLKNIRSHAELLRLWAERES